MFACCIPCPLLLVPCNDLDAVITVAHAQCIDVALPVSFRTSASSTCNEAHQRPLAYPCGGNQRLAWEPGAMRPTVLWTACTTPFSEAGPQRFRCPCLPPRPSPKHPWPDSLPARCGASLALVVAVGAFNSRGGPLSPEAPVGLAAVCSCSAGSARAIATARLSVAPQAQNCNPGREATQAGRGIPQGELRGGAGCTGGQTCKRMFQFLRCDLPDTPPPRRFSSGGGR